MSDIAGVLLTMALMVVGLYLVASYHHGEE